MYNELIWTFARGALQELLTNWQLWALFEAVLLLALAVKLYRVRRLARTGIDDIDRMDGAAFEQRLEILFRSLGYRVEQTRYRGDYGADLVIAKDGVRTVVQAKRYTKNVGLAAVQESVTAKGIYKCQAAMVGTNRAYTKQARTLAKANNVELWDRDRLVKALHSVRR